MEKAVQVIIGIAQEVTQYENINKKSLVHSLN